MKWIHRGSFQTGPASEAGCSNNELEGFMLVIHLFLLSYILCVNLQYLCIAFFAQVDITIGDSSSFAVIGFNPLIVQPLLCACGGDTVSRKYDIHLRDLGAVPITVTVSNYWLSAIIKYTWTCIWNTCHFGLNGVHAKCFQKKLLVKSLLQMIFDAPPPLLSSFVGKLYRTRRSISYNEQHLKTNYWSCLYIILSQTTP